MTVLLATGVSPFAQTPAQAGMDVSDSSDFPVRAELFLPRMAERAKARAASRESVEHAVRTIAFDNRPNALFVKTYDETRQALFVNPSSQRPSIVVGESTARGDGAWPVLMGLAGVPAIGLAILLGRNEATRRKGRDAGTKH